MGVASFGVRGDREKRLVAMMTEVDMVRYG